MIVVWKILNLWEKVKTNYSQIYSIICTVIDHRGLVDTEKKKGNGGKGGPISPLTPFNGLFCLYLPLSLSLSLR